ncbi:hypothetical protein EIN_405590 [Entamoeba invadens IP1]|uniref:EGF-like domain-containing protein n=1 Tax=Entamoeba invadens IP1 TaxID=370355 RepID=A0A0A1U737_ENTIV|nr:hypothetical protein EIN_405590 [Entamoeba invadens IP1]ELP90135.1 hypothetical protein EIN_405590 [Entamoeba invadens IP1]|eukprot:XP_004256906.1 hypothetical protein EIN_405590 [Entamoeba invadens IP1]
MWFILCVQLVASLVTNCKTYDEELCTACNTMYYLVATNVTNGEVTVFECQPVTQVSNCNTYDNNLCTMCMSGYVLDIQNNKCVPCMVTSGAFLCQTCVLENGNTKCLECNNKFTLVQSTNDCIDCSSDLHVNTTQCGYCGEGLYYNTTLGSCDKCQTNCTMCTTLNNCFKCTNNSFLFYTEGSDLCGPLDSCVSGYVKDNYCTKCEEGTQLKNGYCYDCGNNCTYCSVIKSDNNYVFSTCSFCDVGYVITSSKTCKLASDIHCKSGSRSQGCTSCENGYFMNSNWECQQCASHCTSCVQNSTYCTQCDLGFYLDGTGSCTTKDVRCKKTNNGGCIECDNPKDPTSTKDGYYLLNGSCEVCNTTCNSCFNNSNDCLSCKPGYLLIPKENSSYYSCEVKDNLCAESVLGRCTKCREGYFKKQNSNYERCIKCDATCRSCTNETHCVECEDDMYMSRTEYGVCRPLSEINMTCKASIVGCTSCYSHFYKAEKDDFNCTSCPDSCQECVPSPLGGAVCVSCFNDQLYIANGTCAPCKLIDKCIQCDVTGCIKCSENYQLSDGSCYRTSLSTVLIPIGLSVGLVAMCSVIIVVVLVVLYIRRRKECSIDKYKSKDEVL